MNANLKMHLNRANQLMKAQADKHRTYHSFTAGDMVFLKLQPYAQSSVSNRSNHKLSFCYFGPYKVLQRLSVVAYELELPSHAQVYPVFHVCQLRRVIPSKHQVLPTLPSDADIYAIPLQVLDKRWIQRDDQVLEQGLVQWSGSLSAAPTWEELVDLSRHFPSAPAWGQAGFQEQGNVSAPPTTTTHPGNDPSPRPIRRRKANVRIGGPEWHMPAATRST
jgi:hypothetical protein